jgi:hypothetical protein
MEDNARVVPTVREMNTLVRGLEEAAEVPAAGLLERVAGLQSLFKVADAAFGPGSESELEEKIQAAAEALESVRQELGVTFESQIIDEIRNLRELSGTQGGGPADTLKRMNALKSELEAAEADVIPRVRELMRRGFDCSSSLLAPASAQVMVRERSSGAPSISSAEASRDGSEKASLTGEQGGLEAAASGSALGGVDESVIGHSSFRSSEIEGRQHTLEQLMHLFDVDNETDLLDRAMRIVATINQLLEKAGVEDEEGLLQWFGGASSMLSQLDALGRDGVEEWFGKGHFVPRSEILRNGEGRPPPGEYEGESQSSRESSRDAIGQDTFESTGDRETTGSALDVPPEDLREASIISPRAAQAASLRSELSPSRSREGRGSQVEPVELEISKPVKINVFSHRQPGKKAAEGGCSASEKAELEARAAAAQAAADELAGKNGLIKSEAVRQQERATRLANEVEKLDTTLREKRKELQGSKQRVNELWDQAEALREENHQLRLKLCLVGP